MFPSLRLFKWLAGMPLLQIPSCLPKSPLSHPTAAEDALPTLEESEATCPAHVTGVRWVFGKMLHPPKKTAKKSMFWRLGIITSFLFPTFSYQFEDGSSLDTPKPPWEGPEFNVQQIRCQARLAILGGNIYETILSMYRT